MSALAGIGLILWAMDITNLTRSAAAGSKPSRLLTAATLLYTWALLAAVLFAGG